MVRTLKVKIMKIVLKYDSGTYVMVMAEKLCDQDSFDENAGKLC